MVYIDTEDENCVVKSRFSILFPLPSLLGIFFGARVSEVPKTES